MYPCVRVRRSSYQIETSSCRQGFRAGFSVPDSLPCEVRNSLVPPGSM